MLTHFFCHLFWYDPAQRQCNKGRPVSRCSDAVTSVWRSVWLSRDICFHHSSFLPFCKENKNLGKWTRRDFACFISSEREMVICAHSVEFRGPRSSDDELRLSSLSPVAKKHRETFFNRGSSDASLSPLCRSEHSQIMMISIQLQAWPSRESGEGTELAPRPTLRGLN